MRITTANAMTNQLEQLQLKQQMLMDSQTRLTSGKKIARASDDPTNAARAERALAIEVRATASQRALEASRVAMTQAEAALGDSTELVRQARDLLVQAGNPMFTDAQRQDMAATLRGLRSQLLGVANRQDGNGIALFSGQGSSEPPFLDEPGGVVYKGVEGQTQVASGEPLPRSVDGGNAFLRAASGNGVFVTAAAPGNSAGAWVGPGQVSNPAALTGDDYSVVFTTTTQPNGTLASTYAVLRAGNPTAVTAAPYVSGQAITFDGWSLDVRGQPATGDTFTVTASQRDLSVFDTLERVAGELATPNRSDAQRAQTISHALRDLDASSARLIGERSRLGEVLNRTDMVENRIADRKLLARADRSNAEDVDMAEAVSEFQNRQTSYDAALKAYSMVQKMTLFDHLR